MNAPAPGLDVPQTMRQRGALLLPLFALVWAAAGVSGIANSTVATTAGFVVVVATVATLALALRGGLASATRPVQMPADRYRRLGLVNILQAVGIGLAIVILIMIGRPLLIPAAVCLVVGLHFFPLARVFAQAEYTWTGAALCVVSAAGIITFAAVDGQASRVVVGLGAAVSLWATSLHLSWRG